MQSAVSIFSMHPFLAAKMNRRRPSFGLWPRATRPAIFEKVKPVLEHLGQTVHHFGKNGNAAAMKLVGNLIVALEMEALAEGLVLAQKAGLDLNTIMEVVKVADFRSPLLVSNGQNILKRDFSP